VDSGFAAWKLQKRMSVHGRAVILGPLRIRIDAREAEGQTVRGSISLVTFLLLETRKLLA
jgi:hypothetical protein